MSLFSPELESPQKSVFHLGTLKSLSTFSSNVQCGISKLLIQQFIVHAYLRDRQINGLKLAQPVSSLWSPYCG